MESAFLSITFEEYMPIPARLPTFRSISFEEYLPVPAPRVQLKSVTFEEYKENTVEDFTNWF